MKQVIQLHGGGAELHVLSCMRGRLLQFDSAGAEKKLVASMLISLSQTELEKWFGEKLAADIMKEIK